ncbi:hypothetical protein JQC91_13530 [Jannaschia sp. Os4]|uniref:hypothetical protein n=1 Tax=Jannaschia sp. Os4 TaxID=2807617 RepID=UPI001939F79B|nr:hypothetical protein [Jannaschia sp. Os4]MBM2577325.1 hypothetical protein [Jannaschia sp. Os4]
MSLLLRLAILLLIACTITYVCVFYWLRAGARDRLIAEWERGGTNLARETHLEVGLRRWSRRTRRWLPWATYGVPIAATAALVYWINYA